MPRVTAYARLTTQDGGAHPAPISVHDAARFQSDSDVSYGPVSGDQTMRYLGIKGWLLGQGPSIWRGPNVKPKIATAGIRVGDTIETYGGAGVVTRVGSIAGFYMLDGREERWDARHVISIIPADDPERATRTHPTA